MLRGSFPLLLAVGIAVSISLEAHHGPGTFDLSQTVNFPNAKLTRVDLVNPHSWLYFEVTDSEGRVTKHRCEMRSLHVLRRSGWSAEVLPVGQRIDVTASPDKADPQSCYLQTITFRDGTHMDRYGQYVKGAGGAIKEVRGPVRAVETTNRAPRRPTGEPNISGDWASEQVVMIDPRGVGGGMSPLGQLSTAKPVQLPPLPPGGARRGGGPGTGPRLYGGTELTEAGTLASANLKREDNPRMHCETTSIIFDWSFDNPVNRITQNRDTVVMEYGQFNLKRVIHMNMKEHPANIKPSRAGHSIGRWEGDVLVVDTVGFLPGVLNAPVVHSDKLHVVERFSLDTATMRLTRAYEASDPVNLKGTYTGRDVIQLSETPYGQDHCKDQTFIDYSKQTKGR